MRICFLLPCNAIAGGLFTVYEHARRFQEKGHEVTLIFHRALYPLPITCFDGMEGIRALFLSDLGPEESFDFAIATWWETAYEIGRIPAQRYGYFIQGFEDAFYDSPQRAVRYFVEKTYQERFHFFTVSRALRARLRALGQDAVLVPNGVGHAWDRLPTPVLSRKSGTVRVLIEGTHTQSLKRIPLAFSVAQEVPGIEIGFLTADLTPPRPEWKFDHYFNAVPYREVPGIYASFDILLKLSATEGFSLALLDIFASGGTAIVTSFEGHEELARHEENALVVPIDDRTAAVSALRRLVDNPALLSRLKQGARATSLRFNWADSNEGFEKALLSILNGPLDDLRKPSLLADYRADLAEYRRKESGNVPKKLFPDGTFYSPIPSPIELAGDRERLFGPPPDRLPGIDLNAAGQLELLEELRAYYPQLPFAPGKQPGLRYHYENDWYSYTDAIFLFTMLRHLRPKRLFEVGSGYTSGLMLDTIERFLAGQTQCTFIEPDPERLYSLIRPGDLDAHRLLQRRVQDCPPAFFDEMEEGDVLFIDSSHVCKTGSDLCALLFEILPRLRSGVHIHFHDIFYPFEYPQAWVEEGRAWNEAYALRAFLQYNYSFTIRLFSHYLAKFHRGWLEANMPLCLRNTGGSLWLSKR